MNTRHAVFRVALLALLIVVVCGLQGPVHVQAQGDATPKSRPRSAPAAQEDGDQQAREINRQLDEILEIQATILARYDELMEEIVAVKARASR